MNSHGLDLSISCGAIAVDYCQRIYKRMRFAANAAGLQVTQGHTLTGLAAAAAVPEAARLFQSHDFITRLEAMTGATLIPHPNLDLGLQCFIFSTKLWQERGLGCDGLSVWIFCNDVELSNEGAFVCYGGDGAEVARFQPRLGRIICGSFGRVEHEIEPPRTHTVAARLAYVDAKKLARAVMRANHASLS